MISTAEVREMIDDLFEEEALMIGGLVAVHWLDDDLVWRLVRSIDVIRGRILRRLETEAPAEEDKLEFDSANHKPHPAIEEFLHTLRRA